MTDQRRSNSILPERQGLELKQRWLTRERRRVLGLLILALILLAIAFLRFGKTIPWGAR